MRFRTCLALWLSVSSASLGSNGCAASGSSGFGIGDGGTYFTGDSGSSGDASLALYDGSACAPGSVATFLPAYNPSSSYADACTADQLAAVIHDCFDPSTDSQAACDAWESDSRNHACLACWSGPIVAMPSGVTAPPASTWAPYLYVDSPGQTTYVNVSGCIVLADPSQLNCAQDIQYDFSCDLLACEANCPVPTAGSFVSAEVALEACFESANRPAGGGCSMYATAAAACRETLGSSGSAAFCFDAEQEQPQALLQYFTLACGAAPPAEDAGSVTDAGEPSPEAALTAADAEAEASLDSSSDSSSDSSGDSNSEGGNDGGGDGS
jgi:hypothetical protein